MIPFLAIRRSVMDTSVTKDRQLASVYHYTWLKVLISLWLAPR